MTDFARVVEDDTFHLTKTAEDAVNKAYANENYPPFQFHTRVDLINEPIPEGQTHRHVALEWEGGVVWLDMSVQSNHFCIDIRQFNENGEMKGQGAFTIVNGSRQNLGSSESKPLPDVDGNPVTGFNWNGGYVMTLLTDPHGEEKAASLPKAGNG